MSVIFHIDLNCFFATVETILNPEYKGKPLVVAGSSRRSIISTASYEARKYGIHSAMPLYQALELCKDLIVTDVNFDMYHKYSQMFFDYLRTYTDKIEIASIDECYVDVTDIVALHGGQLKLAKAIQSNLMDLCQLPCSIGISPNKFLAKMASDMKKPLGITIINEQNIKRILWPLPIGSMHGIGKKTVPKLESIGINTIGDLAMFNQIDLLKTIFGINTNIIIDRANGISKSVVHPEETELKSVGNSTTLERDTSDEVIIKDTIIFLSDKVSRRAEKRGLVGNNISITIKYTRFASIIRSITIDHYTNSFEEIYANALILFDKIYDNKPLRLLGVSLNNVLPKSSIIKQLDIFSFETDDQENQINEIVREINRELKDEKLTTVAKVKRQLIK